MKKVMIIDDEPLARSIVEEFLKSHEDFKVVATCDNGFDGLKTIEKEQPDLVFLDVQMPKINGFEMLELLENPPAIIFTTAFDEYAIKAFEASAVDYLLKPFSRERFDQAIEKWRKTGRSVLEETVSDLVQKQPDEQLRIVVKDGGEIRIVPTADVIYIEAYDDYVKIHTNEGYHLKKKTMIHYEKTLNPSEFIRIHRSYIININTLSKIESYEKNSYQATLTNGVKVPVSRSSYSGLKSILGI